jgi:hypothetical protein
MEKQTAVQWLIEQINPYGLSVHQDAFKTALEMEKQQIIDAFEQGEYTGRGFEDVTSEEYYNINFKSE